MLSILAWVGVLIVTVSSTGLLLSRDWRWDIGFLAAQYVGVGLLVAQHWPVGMAAVKLVTGWMTTAAIAMTLTSLPVPEEPEQGFWPEGRTFRVFLVGVVLVVTLAATPRVQSVISGIGAPVVAGTIILAGVGLLQLGTSAQVLRVVVALLTVLAGFEVLYAALETSILVAALLAVVNLGIGLVGAYLLNASAPEEQGL